MDTLFPVKWKQYRIEDKRKHILSILHARYWGKDMKEEEQDWLKANDPKPKPKVDYIPGCFILNIEPWNDPLNSEFVRNIYGSTTISWIS
jgi:hypothetical protein